MKKANQKDKNIPTLKSVKCPACDKPRIYRYVKEDGTIDQPSDKTINIRGEVRYVDVCKFCQAKYERKDEIYIRNNMKRVSKAMQDRTNSDEEFYLDEL